MFQNFENQIKGAADLAVIADIDGEAGIPVSTGDGVAVGKEDVGKFQAVMGTWFDVECGEVRRAKKKGVYDEGLDGESVSIEAEVCEFEVVRHGRVRRSIEKVSGAGVAVVVAGLRLGGADFSKFG